MQHSNPPQADFLQPKDKKELENELASDTLKKIRELERLFSLSPKDMAAHKKSLQEICSEIIKGEKYNERQLLNYVEFMINKGDLYLLILHYPLAKKLLTEQQLKIDPWYETQYSTISWGIGLGNVLAIHTGSK